MSNVEKLSRQRADILEKISTKKQQIGVMATTARSDPSYSSASLQNWQADLASLEDRLAEIDGELAAATAASQSTNGKPKEYMSAGARKLQDRASALQARRRDIQEDLEKTRTMLAEKRSTMGDAIVAGGDASLLAGDVTKLVERETGLVAALQSIDDELMGIKLKIAMDESQAATVEAQKLIKDLQAEGLQLFKDAHELRRRARRIASIGQDIQRLKSEHHLESASLASHTYNDEANYAGQLFLVLDSLRRRTELVSPKLLERAHIDREF